MLRFDETGAVTTGHDAAQHHPSHRFLFQVRIFLEVPQALRPVARDQNAQPVLEVRPVLRFAPACRLLHINHPYTTIPARRPAARVPGACQIGGKERAAGSISEIPAERLI